MPDTLTALTLAAAMVEAQTCAMFYEPVPEVPPGPDYVLTFAYRGRLHQLDMYVEGDLARLYSQAAYVDYLYALLIGTIETVEEERK